MAERSTIDKIADAVTTPMALGFGIVVGLFIGAGRRRVRVGPGGGRTHAGYTTILCAPHGEHSICVLKDNFNQDHYTFTIDNGPPSPDNNVWYSAESARRAAERFMENLT